MPTLCDYAFEKPTLAQLEAAGVDAVGRYVGPASWGKCIGTIEFGELMSAHIAVWLVFEQDINNYQGGFAQGVADAHLALENVPHIEFGVTRPIYFAVDTEVNPSDCIAYFEGVCSVIGRKMVGCYGQGTLLELLLAQGLASWFWLSESTSFPGWNPAWPELHIWQDANNPPPVPGSDLNHVGPAGIVDFGQHPAPNTPQPIPPKPPEEEDMTTDSEMIVTPDGVRHQVTEVMGGLVHTKQGSDGVWRHEILQQVAGGAVASVVFDHPQAPHLQKIGNQLICTATAGGHTYEFAQTFGQSGWGVNAED